jgi:hypothetical protein
VVWIAEGRYGDRALSANGNGIQIACVFQTENWRDSNWIEPVGVAKLEGTRQAHSPRVISAISEPHSTHSSPVRVLSYRCFNCLFTFISRYPGKGNGHP